MKGIFIEYDKKTRCVRWDLMQFYSGRYGLANAIALGLLWVLHTVAPWPIQIVLDVLMAGFSVGLGLCGNLFIRFLFRLPPPENWYLDRD
ncbi:MAG: hypothetical protein ACYDHY_15345 [Acidiferrobacterales bacterium]